MAYAVVLTPQAQEQFDGLPLVIRARVVGILERLAAWPDLSGVKPLRHDRKGQYRVRTGDWRVVFTVDIAAEVVTVIAIDNRRDVYE